MYYICIVQHKQLNTTTPVMTTLTANIPESAAARIEKYIQRYGGQVVAVKKARTKLPIKELEEALCEVKAIQEGRMPGRSLSEAFSD